MKKKLEVATQAEVEMTSETIWRLCVFFQYLECCSSDDGGPQDDVKIRTKTLCCIEDDVYWKGYGLDCEEGVT